MKNVIQGSVTIIVVLGVMVGMFAMVPPKEGQDYSSKFTEVDQKLETIGTQMLSQSSAVNKLSADFAAFKSAASDDFDSGGSDESIKDESSWSPPSINTSGGGSSGTVISSSSCTCGPNCNCGPGCSGYQGYSVSYSQPYYSQPVYQTSSGSGSTGGYSSGYQPTIFSGIRAARPVQRQPILRRGVTCVNGQCYLN